MRSWVPMVTWLNTTVSTSLVQVRLAIASDRSHTLATVSRSIQHGTLARKPSYGASNVLAGSGCAPLILTSVQLE